jgi:hypothetical protein
MTTKELFITEIDKHWEKLKNRDDVIFENISIKLDAEEKFEALRDSDPLLYQELFHENSTYEKKKMIQEYFWDNIVGELYENTVDIMHQAGILEEAQKSFEKSYKIENTAKLILENGIFANFNSKKKKELIDPLIESFFYPHSFVENNRSLLDLNFEALEETRITNFGNSLGSGITNAARLSKSLLLLLATFFISPATTLIGNPGARTLDAVNQWATGAPPANKGLNPTTRKFYAFLDNFGVVKLLFVFLNQDLTKVAEFLKRSNTLDNDYVDDILKEVGANPSQIVDKCWAKNKHQIPVQSNTEKSTFWSKIGHLLNGKGIANFLRNPLYNNDTQIALLLKSDSADPHYQKMFYDFRVCVYEKVFEIILGFAKAIYSMDDASYEIIKHANEVHKNKNFKAFFDLRPKQDNEEAMFAIMKALVAIDDIANTLEKRKGELVADKYIDKFNDFLRQNIKQTYQQLDEMANQKKYNADRYEEEDPDDETKAKKIAEERFNAKKSIFM